MCVSGLAGEGEIVSVLGDGDGAERKVWQRSCVVAVNVQYRLQFDHDKLCSCSVHKNNFCLSDS